MLDRGEAVKNFVAALQQLTNPEMIFRVKSANELMKLVVFGLSVLTVICSTQDWWDAVKNKLEKPGFDEKQMADMYEEMTSLLMDRNADGHGVFRKKFIQVCSDSDYCCIRHLPSSSVSFHFHPYSKLKTCHVSYQSMDPQNRLNTK